MKKSIVFVDRKCEACNGEGCEACDGTGSVGSVEERDVPEVHPDGVSKALEKERLARGLSFRDLGFNLVVSTPRASQLCRGAGKKMSKAERFFVAHFLGRVPRENFESIVLNLAEIGDGDILRGIKLVNAIAERLRHARSKHAWPAEADGKFQALGVIHAEYRELEQAIEHDEGREREKDEALDVIATAARFWMGEHERQ